MKFAAAAILFAALASSVQAFQITEPSSTWWWIQNSQNVLAWTCGLPANEGVTYIVSLYQPTGDLANGEIFLSNVPDASCSYLVQPSSTAGLALGNYTLKLLNSLNSSDIIGVTDTFELKPSGSLYPTTSTSVASTSASATTPSSSSTTTSTTTKKGAAAGPVGASSAIISSIAFVICAFLA